MVTIGKLELPEPLPARDHEASNTGNLTVERWHDWEDKC